MQRAEEVFRRKPAAAVHDDSSATSSWHGGTRIMVAHPNGTQIASDMPSELGGTGDRITPGWLFRAGIASCAATTIAMTAAANGIELVTLEVQVTSRSDSRGLLGMSEPDGKRVSAGPRDYGLAVRVAAPGVTPERLRAIVDEGLLRSPMQHALKSAMPLTLRIEVAAT
jgi:uncharacterized OsmC-like protein